MNASMSARTVARVSFGRRRGITPAPALSLGFVYRVTACATPAPAAPRLDRGFDR